MAIEPNSRQRTTTAKTFATLNEEAQAKPLALTDSDLESVIQDDFLFFSFHIDKAAFSHRLAAHKSTYFLLYSVEHINCVGD